MRAKLALIVSLLAAFMLAVIAPVRANAQQYYYQNDNPNYYQNYRRDRRDRERREREWREHQRREWCEHHRDWKRDRDWR